MAKNTTKIDLNADNDAIVEALNARIQRNLDDVDQGMWANIWQSIGSIFGIINIGASWGKEAVSYHKELAQLNRAEDVIKQLDKLKKKRK